MNLIDLSIRRPVFAWILMAALIVFGAISLNRLGISQMPDVNFPVINISVNYEGAAPEVIETELLDIIESRLLAIEGIKEMRSSARQGSGSVTIELDIERNVDVALQEVQSAMSQLKLPTGVDTPVIRKTNPEEDPVMYVSIYGEMGIREMLTWTDETLLDQLRFLPGVGEVSIAGFSERNLRIWLDPDKLQSAYLTVKDVLDAITTQHLETAAGQYNEGKRELRVRWLGEAATPEQVENIKILRRGGQIIYDRLYRVKDVAKVEDGLSDIRRMSFVDGKPSISISIKKQRGTNEVQIAKSLRAKLDKIQSTFPAGLHSRVAVDFTKPTEATVALTIEKLWMAALVTILVCILFLGNWQAALNILFSIPTSIVGTFLILYFSGFTLNIFTLLALTLSISIVVDDAIMLLENIVRHYRMGKGAKQAASEGAKEVLPAATAATLAVMAVFLPVIFMKGTIGKFFFQFGITMSAAVLLSLLEAVTITPMRAAALLSEVNKVTKFEHFLDRLFERLSNKYRNLLHFSLKYPVTIVLISILLFGASIYSTKNIKQEIVPSQDQNIIMVMGQTPPGTSLDATAEAAKRLAEVVKNESVVEGFSVSVGAGGPNSQVNQIFMPITLISREKRKENHQAIMARWRIMFKELKGLRVTMRDISARNLVSGRPNPLAFNIRGGNLDILEKKSSEIIDRLTKEGLAVDLDTDFRRGIPELLITPDREAMASRGVSIETVAQTLAVSIGGLRQGRFTANGHRYDIRFKLPDDKVQKAADITRLFVQNIYGNLVPLSSLVKVTESSAIQAISRINRKRAISVYGNLAPGKSQAEVIKRTFEIAKEVLPDESYTIDLEGASAGMNETFGGLYFALGVGILVAYMVLAIQFNSFIHPITVLVALPFSISGALLALWGTGASLNLFSFIGLIVLMGIAKKNSIMLVEFANQLRHIHGQPVHEAVLHSGQVRLRPILMTSVATVVAALPLVIGGGIGSETRLPMGLAIIGGTLVSTLLTLVVVPSVYLLFSKLERSRK